VPHPPQRLLVWDALEHPVSDCLGPRPAVQLAGTMVRGAPRESQFSSAFGVESMMERFDRNAALYLLEHIDEFIPDAAKREDALEKIKKLLENSQGDSSIKVTYTKATNAKQRGRWFASTTGAMQGMNRKVRHTICDGVWIDLDFVNCHPVLLSLMCNNLLRRQHALVEGSLQGVCHARLPGGNARGPQGVSGQL